MFYCINWVQSEAMEWAWNEPDRRCHDDLSDSWMVTVQKSTAKPREGIKGTLQYTAGGCWMTCCRIRKSVTKESLCSFPYLLFLWVKSFIDLWIYKDSNSTASWSSTDCSMTELHWASHRHSYLLDSLALSLLQSCPFLSKIWMNLELPAQRRSSLSFA